MTAAAVAFLASDDSSFITASSVLVDASISGAYARGSFMIMARNDPIRS